MKRLIRYTFLLAPIALALLPVAKAAGPGSPLPANSHPYGHTYGEWAGLWWNWALAEPVDKIPLFDDTGALCAQAQAGPVWFLAGTLGGTANRDCSVPAGKALLMPIVNEGVFNFPGDTFDLNAEQAGVAADAHAAAGSLTFAVDGKPLAPRDIAASFEESGAFNITMPVNNVFGLDPGTVVGPSVDAGYYLILSPLPPGTHTISYGGTIAGATVSVTYTLHVVPGH
jgi:hypothetical protein